MEEKKVDFAYTPVLILIGKIACELVCLAGLMIKNFFVILFRKGG